tara:strand:- start:1578 stop:2210 length:633 start_codon:yes stop_codon:yes gene_type:complete
MTLLHRTLEKLYFLLEKLDPENLTDKQIKKVIKRIENSPRFTKENIDFYKFKRLDKIQLKEQAQILTKRAHQFRSKLYTLDLEMSTEDIYFHFEEIRKYGSHIIQILGGSNIIYTPNYIATKMAIENNFIYQPEGISVTKMVNNYVDRYFKNYKVSIKADTLRKEYISQFTTAPQTFRGTTKENNKIIVESCLSTGDLKTLRNYMIANPL